MSGEAARYLASRLVTAALTVFGAMTLLFALTTLVPGDPATTLLGPQATPEAARQFVRDMGLDKPIHERFLHFFGNVLSGDLGVDVLGRRPVSEMIASVLPSTSILIVAAMSLAIATGVPLGVYAATHRGSRMDNLLAFVSVAFIAVPGFVVAILLLLVFSIWLDWLPVLGAGKAGDWADQGRRLILPATALAIGWIGFIARLMRSSMLEVMGENYIRTARAYGIARRTVVYKYALKNACIPTIAVLGIGIGRLLVQAVFVEIVFARPGIGRLIYEAVSVRNFPVVQGAVLVVVVLFVLINLAVDLCYSAIDPRIRREIGRAGAGA